MSCLIPVSTTKNVISGSASLAKLGNLFLVGSIRRLTLRDFRSYAALDLRLSGAPVVLTGPNGAGKTNLLEAVSLLGPGRGLRGAKLSDVQRQGAEGFGVGVSLGSPAEPDATRLSIRAAPPKPERREARIDGQPASGPGAFLDYLSLVWLTPAQDRLFVEGASERRRFLDRMTLTQDRAHAAQSTRYEHAMRQRTAALTAGRADPRLLTALELQMAETGTAIAAARRATAAQLAAGYETLRAHGQAFPAAEVALEGLLEEDLAEARAPEVEARFAERLAEVRARDAEAGRALDGPHRADLHVRHAGKDQPARLCSTGEQKALLIGLVLAGAAARPDADTPLVLLLDEVNAHLDDSRRAALAEIVTALGCQAFMTGTDAELFSDWRGRAEAYRVAGGEVAPSPL